MGSTRKVLEVCYAMKLCISECSSSEPSVPCDDITRQTLYAIQSLHNCHFLLNANMHTPTADTNPLYTFLIIYLALSTCVPVFNAHTVFSDTLYDFNKEDSWDKVSCSLIDNFLCTPSYLTPWIKGSYTIIKPSQMHSVANYEFISPKQKWRISSQPWPPRISLLKVIAAACAGDHIHR